MKSMIRLANHEELQQIHDRTMVVLKDVGMKMDEEHILEVLKKQGCKVDHANKRVYIKPGLVESTLTSIKNDIETGKLKQNILNGPVASKTDGKIRAKFGGACIEIYDYEKDQIRKPSSEEIVDSIQLGEALPEVNLVGNTLMYLEEKGQRIDPRMQRIKTCELVAKNTSKPASTEIFNITELDLQIEMGIVVRGSREAFLENPCFVTAKETISPLRLEKEAAVMLLALAERGLPCTIIPMPMIGISTPLARESAIVIGNAEILGSMTAIRALYPDAKVAGGIGSGAVNMRSGSISLSTPEPIYQDLLLAQLYEDMYGQDCGILVGGIDAKYPGIQATTEKLAKMMLSYLSGRTNYLVGLLAGITRFSAEEAIIELELAKYIHAIFRPLMIDNDSVPLDLIKKLGPGGNFFEEDHTLFNFRKVLWLTDIFDLSKTTGKASEDKQKDILVNANQYIKDVMSKHERYHLPKDKEKEIDRIVKKAEEIL